MYPTGSFFVNPSFIHRVDPRIKLMLTVAMSFFILTAGMSWVLAMGIVLLLAARIGKIKLRTMGQAVRPLLFFIFLIFLVHLFFNEYKEGLLIRIPWVNITLSAKGAQEAFLVTTRFLCLIAAAVLLTMTTSPSQMIAAMKYFLQPLQKLRVPVDRIAFLISLALRFMPVLFEEKERVETAQKARGYDMHRAGLVTRLKAFFSLTVTILLKVFSRADELAAAMEARNFPKGKRSSFIELKLTFTEGLVLAAILIFIFFFLALNFRFS